MPKATFTPEEEQTIQGLESQFNRQETLPGTNVGIRVGAPNIQVDFPTPPPPQIGVGAYQEAAKKPDAIIAADTQIESQIAAAEAAVDQWIAALNNHHRYFELYREAYRRARARL